ncbi:MAG: hypothetical protein ACI8WW_001052 [Oceanospirillaceae bacterium]|jgi:hypothetical protein
MKNLKLFFLMLITASFCLASCGDDDSTGSGDVLVTAINASGTSFEDGSAVEKDLNGAASAVDVPLDAVFKIDFDKEITAESANDINVTITPSGGNAVSATVTSSGMTVTLTPTDDLQRGTLHTLNVSNVTTTDGAVLSSINRTFTTEGRAPVVVPNIDNQIAYWSFDGTADDATGDYPAANVVAITYEEDRFGQGGSVAAFDGNESIIEIADADRLIAGNSFTTSIWMKTDDTDHVNENGDPAGFFVFGLGAFLGFQLEIPSDQGFVKFANSYVLDSGDAVAEDMFYNGEPLMAGDWQGWEFQKGIGGADGVRDLVANKWAHIIFSYDAAEKRGTLYINGELVKAQDFDLWPDGDPKRTTAGVTYQGTEPDVEDVLAFGFVKSINSEMWADTPWGDYAKPTANHFKGQLDDVRFFDAAFSTDDATSLYNAEKP